MSQEDRITTSLKYQVICDDTALVGVIKQTDKATGELKEVNVKFERNTSSQQAASQQNSMQSMSNKEKNRKKAKKMSATRGLAKVMAPSASSSAMPSLEKKAKGCGAPKLKGMPRGGP